jgi:nucleotide-binding universal stress UspA family protein
MYKNILVPIEPGHGAVCGRIIAVARLLAGGRGNITLLTVMEQMPGYVSADIPQEILAASRASATTALHALAREAGVDEAHVLIRDGNAATTILAEAERLGADAIVLGSHRPGLSDYLIGSTSARVVRHAQCTVVVERSAVS